jgi:hypothetical protein
VEGLADVILILLAYLALVTVVLLAVTALIGFIAGRGDRATAAARTLALVGVFLALVGVLLAFLALGPLAGSPNYGAAGAIVGGSLLLAIGDVLALVACTTGLTSIVIHRAWPDLWWLGTALLLLLIAPAGIIYRYFGIVPFIFPLAALLAVASIVVALGALLVAVWGTRAGRRSAPGGATS